MKHPGMENLPAVDVQCEICVLHLTLRFTTGRENPLTAYFPLGKSTILFHNKKKKKKKLGSVPHQTFPWVFEEGCTYRLGAQFPPEIFKIVPLGTFKLFGDPPLPSFEQNKTIHNSQGNKI